MTADEELLPRPLRVLVAFLRAAPMTELKTFSGIVLLFGTAGWLALASAFGRWVSVNEAVLDIWLLFLSGLLAITAFGQGWKQSVAAKSVAAGVAASAMEVP